MLMRPMRGACRRLVNGRVRSWSLSGGAKGSRPDDIYIYIYIY